MNRSNTTNLRQVKGGRVVKQGDSASLFAFELLDEKWRPVKLEGQQARVDLIAAEGKAVFEAVVSQSKVSFNISNPLPIGSYLVEVHCAGYVFPSDQSVRLEVTQSSEKYETLQDLQSTRAALSAEIASYLASHPIDVSGLITAHLAEHPIQAYNDGPLVARIEVLEARPQATTIDLGPLESRVQALESKPAPTIQTLDLGPLEKRVETLENKSAPTAPAVDLSAYMTSEMAYQTFATYTTLQAQMTNNIKTKHLELGLDALIDDKLRNGGDNFLTSHQASTAYASKEAFQNLLKRVEVLESVPI